MQSGARLQVAAVCEGSLDASHLTTIIYFFDEDDVNCGNRNLNEDNRNVSNCKLSPPKIQGFNGILVTKNYMVEQLSLGLAQSKNSPFGRFSLSLPFVRNLQPSLRKFGEGLSDVHDLT